MFANVVIILYSFYKCLYASSNTAGPLDKSVIAFELPLTCSLSSTLVLDFLEAESLSGASPDITLHTSANEF